MALKSAFGVVRLRRLVRQGGRRERAGRAVIPERGPSPTAAICKPLAVLHHEVHVMLDARHLRIWEKIVLRRYPMDLRHLDAVRERPPVVRYACKVGLNHLGIGEDRGNCLVSLTGGNNLPAFVSPKLR